MEKPIFISGVVITYNEEQNIARCLESMQPVCSEIVVVDSFSTDNTERICKDFGVRFITKKFEGHIEQKNFAMEQATHDFVLSLDADEALSEKLTQSIKSIDKNWEGKAFKFNRFTNYCSQWIRHSGWYPDTKVRLWDRRIGKWGGTNPHDQVQLNRGMKPDLLQGDLLHYSFKTVHEHTLKAITYAKTSASAMYKEGRKSTYMKRYGSPFLNFINNYFLRLGFLDGYFGLVICVTSSYVTFLKYTYLKELNHNAKRH